MKTLKVGIASYEDMKARTMAIARGELRPKPGDAKVWFTSPESFAKLLSNRNRALLAQIADTHPASLHELAGAVGRDRVQFVAPQPPHEPLGLIHLCHPAFHRALPIRRLDGTTFPMGLRRKFVLDHLRRT